MTTSFLKLHRPAASPAGDGKTKPWRILLVEDDEAHSEILKRAFEGRGATFELTHARTLSEALEFLKQTSFSLVISDWSLPDGTGIELLTGAGTSLSFPFLLMTSQGNEQIAVQAMKAGAQDYVVKSEITLSEMPHIAERTLRVWGERVARERAEARLHEMERWLATTLRSIGDAVITTDTEGQVTFLNPGAEALTGYPLEEARGVLLSEIFPARHEHTDAPLAELPREDGSQHDTCFLSDDILLRSRAGTEAYIEVSVAPVRDEQGRTNGTVVVFRDCSSRKRIEKEMRRVQGELKHSNQTLLHRHDELQAFYHTVSHEIKTPLTAVREFVSLTLEGLAGPLTETQKEYLGIAHESCDQLRMCIDDLLDTTRLDTGKMSLQTKPGSIGALAERMVTTLAPAAGRKNLTLEAKVAAGLPDVAMDESRIAQVLANLVNNAIKFTPEGGRITVGVDRPGVDGSFIVVTVRDTGRGIAPEHLNRIFDRLYQVDREDASEEKGLGLGLHICEELVRMHGGSLRVESEVGKGSAFSFLLPLSVPAKPRVLIVDDDPALSDVMRQILERAEFEVVLAAHGKEAIARLEEGSAALIIMDLVMPEMDGPTTLQEVRARWPSVPVIIHTGFPDSKLMSRALEHSPFTLLAKPCDARQLLQIVRQQITTSPLMP